MTKAVAISCTFFLASRAHLMYPVTLAALRITAKILKIAQFQFAVMMLDNNNTAHTTGATRSAIQNSLL